jgi:hypothetical protein
LTVGAVYRLGHRVGSFGSNLGPRISEVPRDLIEQVGTLQSSEGADCGLPQEDVLEPRCTEKGLEIPAFGGSRVLGARNRQIGGGSRVGSAGVRGGASRRDNEECGDTAGAKGRHGSLCLFW